MSLDLRRLQRACRALGRESRNAVICLLTLVALMVSGILADRVSTPADAATGILFPLGDDNAGLSAFPQHQAFSGQTLDFAEFPDLAAELADLTGNGSLATAALGGLVVPASPFVFSGGYDSLDPAIDCLAAAAWYEAGNDPAGQRSVIQVVLNRVSHPRFPKSVCSVVFQGSERVTGCQFSFTCDGSIPRRMPTRAAWNEARDRAMAALSGSVDPTVGQATHFHADYVAPVWASEMEPLAKVGAHLFYRWPGERGHSVGPPALAVETPKLALAGLSAHPVELGILPEELANAPPIEPDTETLPLQPNPAQAAETLAVADLPVAASPPEPVTVAASSLSASGTLVVAALEVAQSDRWTRDALARCERRSECRVVGYESAGAGDSHGPGLAGIRDRPAFLFVRDPVSNSDLALWDCERIARSNPAECLPATGAALDRLMHELARETFTADARLSDSTQVPERTILAHDATRLEAWGGSLQD